MFRLRAPDIAASLCAAALCVAALPGAASAATADEIIVKRDDGLTASARAGVRADAGVTLVEPLPLEDTEVVRAAPGDAADALADLRADPDVVWAEPNRERDAAGVAEPYFPLMWGLENTGQTITAGTQTATGTPDADIDAPEAWRFTEGRGVTVGVVDSGAQTTHPDLQLVTGHDFVDGDSNTDDPYGHGTHVSGIIAAAENGRGVIGVAPRARVMPLRILDATGHGTSANSAAAFASAGDLGLKVVNASIGSTGSSQAEYDAIAAHPGTLYVVAAGNGGADEIGDDDDVTPTYPCAYDLANILCVGATDSSDQPADFSNYGLVSVDVSAPGVNVISTYKGSGYAYMDGTSMATPHAAGVAALLAARDPSLTAAQIKQAIMDGADREPSLTGRSQTGARLDAVGALARLPADATPPAPPSGVTATAGTNQVGLSWAAAPEEDVAAYRVYPVPGAAPLATLAATAQPAWLATGLAAGTPARYRVTAVDASGNESAASGVVTATPPAPAAALPAPPALDAVPPAPVAPPATPTLRSVKLSGRAVVCTHGCTTRTATLRFTLGAAAPVRVTVLQKVCRSGRCSYRLTGAKTLRLGAGPQRLKIGGTVAGVRLRPGTWRIMLSTPKAIVRVPVTVRSR